MAEVEIYKLKNTIDPAVKDYGMFEFFGMGGPFPQNYVREWSGELNSGNLETLIGRFMLNPPKDYHGGPLEKSDIAVVDGEAYFLDRESGYKFVDVDFDTSEIKDAVHVDYGYYVNTGGAETVSRKIAEICGELDIPIGYFSEPDYHGSHKGDSSFESMSLGSYATAYLHPQFLKGAEARDFIGLLTELSVTERWPEIRDYLIGNYPVYRQDLETAREQFAPELLLPEELRPLSKVIPTDADKSELAYLAAKVIGLDDEQRRVFDAVIDAGWHCGSVADIINLTGNLERFDIQPVLDPKEYGAFHINKAREEYEEFINKLEQSDPTSIECSFFYYFAGVEHNVDLEAYGEFLAELDGGEFTKHGYLTTKSAFQEFYRGPEDIPAEYRVLAYPEPKQYVKAETADLAAFVYKIHALAGEYMSDAHFNVSTLTGGSEFYLMLMNGKNIRLCEMSSAYRRDSTDNDVWFRQAVTPDTKAFALHVTDCNDSRISGCVTEIGHADQRQDIIAHCVGYTIIDAELKDGTKRTYTPEQWAALEPIDHDMVDYWRRRYDMDDIEMLDSYVIERIEQLESSANRVPPEMILEELNRSFTEKTAPERPELFRIACDAAKEITARGDAPVYRLLPDKDELLTPLDVVRHGLQYSQYRDFAIKSEDIDGFLKWAERGAGDIARRSANRDEREKPKSRGEEL